MAHASLPHLKGNKRPKKDERGRRTTTKERPRRSEGPNASRTPNESGESGPPYLGDTPNPRPFHPEFLKPSLPAPHEKASLKPPLTTMPGSLFPRSPSMFPDFASILQTPRIQRATNGTPLPTLEQSDPIGAEVHQTLEDHRAEADISSGALSQQPRCGSLLTPTCRRRSIPTQTFC